MPDEEETPFINVDDKMALSLVGYLYQTGKCAYCHKEFDYIPDADNFTKHLIECVYWLEINHKKSYDDNNLY